MKTLTIYLSNEQTLTEWAINEANSMLNDRYNLVHLALDMGAPYHTVRRFVMGKNVSLSTLDLFIDLYLSKCIH